MQEWQKPKLSQLSHIETAAGPPGIPSDAFNNSDS